VLADGEEVVARFPDFEITVRSGGGCLRHYSWDGVTRSVYLIPRDGRWGRETGLYWPGTGHHWRRHGSVSRAVARESVIETDSIEDALDWLRRRDSTDGSVRPYRQGASVRPKGHSFVYRDDGLVVGVGLWPPRGQLNVDVFQILVNGEKPTSMPGSTNDAIVVRAPQAMESPR
jgi:hypothetical protein